VSYLPANGQVKGFVARPAQTAETRLGWTKNNGAAHAAPAGARIPMSRDRAPPSGSLGPAIRSFSRSCAACSAVHSLRLMTDASSAP